MPRRHVEVPTPALALRRTEAAAALGISVEVFDEHVRPFVPCVRTGGVITYPVAGLTAWLDRTASSVLDDVHNRKAA